MDNKDLGTQKVSINPKEVLADLSVEELMARVPGQIYLKDLKGVYLGANANDTFSCALDGTTRGEALFGKTDYDFPWREQAEMIRRNDKEIIDTGKSNIFIEQVKLKDGRMVTFCSIKAPLKDKKGNIIGVIGHSSDISNMQKK